MSKPSKVFKSIIKFLYLLQSWNGYGIKGDTY